MLSRIQRQCNKTAQYGLPSGSVCTQLGYHGVVVHGDGGAFAHSSVYSHSDPLYIEVQIQDMT